MKCIIFDMDGVLTDTEPLHYEVWKQVFAERGLEIDYEHYKDCIGSTRLFLCELLLKHYGRDFRNDASLPVRFAELKEQFLNKHGIPEIPGAAQAVKALHKKGYTLAVASSSPLRYIEFSMKELGIDSCFTLLFSGEQVKNPKPAPDTFLAAAKKLNVSPKDCIVIEDSANGSRAAHAAGMYCFGFANPHSGNQDLSAADDIFYDFNELPEKIFSLK